jgi:hypothetical protein
VLPGSLLKGAPLHLLVLEPAHVAKQQIRFALRQCHTDEAVDIHNALPDLRVIVGTKGIEANKPVDGLNVDALRLMTFIHVLKFIYLKVANRLHRNSLL